MVGYCMINKHERVRVRFLMKMIVIISVVMGLVMLGKEVGIL